MRKPIPFGKYLLLERVNVGGMAEVFLAKAFGVEGFERMLAIKRILPTMVEDDEFITMFLDEARISVQLNHANIVHVTDLGKHDESYYIAMEYVSGKDLRHLIERYRKRREAMSVAQAVFICSKICEGLDYAHRRKDARGQDLNIIHRDVSPQNVLLSFEGEVKIIDFGIAKAANRAQKTQAGILKGKFGYMSPEQVRGMPIDHRSDIFAVGVILYEMLTGERLFVGESDFSTLEKVRNAEVLPPREFNSNIPAGLEKVVLKALAREPEDRYQWCSDLQEDLLRYLLAGDSIYTSKHLGSYMKDAFAEDLEREKLRLERFASVERPDGVELSGVTAAPRPAARAATPAPAPRMPTPAPRAPTPLPTAAPSVDPYNPVIPPPDPEELEEMGSGDRTEIFRGPFDATADKRHSLLGEESEPTVTPAGKPNLEEADDLESEAATILGLDAPIYDEPRRKAPAAPGPSHKVEVRAPAQDGEAATVLGMEAPSYDEPRRRVRPKVEIESEGETVQGLQAPQYDEPRRRRPTPEPDQDEPTPPPDAPAEQAIGEAETVLGLQAPSYDASRRPAPRRRPSRHEAPASESLEENSEDEDPHQGSTVMLAREQLGGELDSTEDDDVEGTPTGRHPGKPFAPEATGRSKLPLVFAVVGIVAVLGIGGAALFLRPSAPGKLVVLAKPPIADIEVDGKPISSGETVELPPGKHEIVVSARGHQEARQTVELASEQVLPLEIALKRAVAPKPPPEEPAEDRDTPEEAAAGGDEEPGNRKDEDVAPPKPQAPAEPVHSAREEPAPEPAKQVKAQPKGTRLKVESEPNGASVEIGGKPAGKTPVIIEGFDADKNPEIRVFAKGYKSAVQHAYWDGEAKEVSVFAILEKEAAPPPPSPKPPAPQKAQPKPAKVAKAPKGFGKLVTMSNPVAKIAIDGKDTGRWTPVAPKDPLEIPAGDHTITYTAADGRKATRKVSVAVDEMVKLVGVSDFK